MSHTLITDNGTAIRVEIKPYISKRKRKQVENEDGKSNEPETIPAIQSETVPKAKTLFLNRSDKPALIRNTPTHLNNAKIRKEIQKEKTIKSIRDKLGKSKHFKERDEKVLFSMQEPTIISHKFVYNIFWSFFCLIFN